MDHEREASADSAVRSSEAEEKCGWMKRFDELQAEMMANGGRMPGPWHWEIQDSSMAVLCGGGEDAITGHIMSVGPCEACNRDKDEWLWGRCGTPYEANARLIAAAPDLLAALRGVISQDEIDSYDVLLPEWKAVADALAKAEGRTMTAPPVATRTTLS